MIITEEKREITSSTACAEMMRAILRSEHETDQKKEHFWVIGLSNQKRVEYIELVSLGVLNKSLIHPRETFRLAIMKAVDIILLIHNHPGGNPEPSNDDINITERLKAAGDIIGIQVIDHLIITKEKHYSFRGMGLMEKNPSPEFLYGQR